MNIVSNLKTRPGIFESFLHSFKRNPKMQGANLGLFFFNSLFLITGHAASPEFTTFALVMGTISLVGFTIGAYIALKEEMQYSDKIHYFGKG